MQRERNLKKKDLVIFLFLIIVHLSLSQDIKTNPSWLTGGRGLGGGGALQFSRNTHSRNLGENPPSDIIWISNSNLPLINTSMNASASGQIQ